MNRLSFIRQICAVLVATFVLSVISPVMADDGPIVVLKTSMGDIEIQLDPVHAPISTANFLSYVKKGFYDGTIFHRIMAGFMVQGGGMGLDMKEKPTDPPIKNEATNGLKNLKGTISMARTDDPDSATSQFFLNLVDNSFLDPNPQSAGYAVFGKIIKGLPVLEKMGAVETGDKGPYQNVPLTPVVLISATVK
jgi:peptidyl-prolyl cis-trans isomerase A (cyclophilin A)